MTNKSYQSKLPALVKLGGLVVTGSAIATAELTAIPQIYRDLLISLDLRSNAAGANDTIGLRFASSGVSYDTGANYDLEALRGTGGTPTAVEVLGNTSMSFISFPAAGGTANKTGIALIHIHDYSGVVNHKSLFIGGGRWFGTSSGDGSSTNVTALWRNTNPIVAVQVFFSVGSIDVGSSVDFYGLR